MMEEKKERASIKEYFQFGELIGYFFRKKSTEKQSFNLRSIHFINKLSMTMFLLGIVYLVVKNVFF